ncbi:MAG: hypothetical protein HYW24_00740 [Candidatus Aenigmarchaeota archaeon]|nr:hypothetical protein [Candidatus Aenigmarchaeota archaeon]
MAEMKGMHHKHVVPLTVATAMVVYGLLQQFYPAGGPWNWVITGVLVFLIAGMWHDKMCKMG